MNKIPTIEASEANEQIAPLYEAVQKKLGLLPNMVKALGNNAAALNAYLGISGALGEGRLPAKTREKIALFVAEQNGCHYCLSAHTAIGGLLKIPASEIESARRGEAEDVKEQAILELTRQILATRGAVTDEVYEAARAAGVTTEEVTELVAHVAVNVFTNYFNSLAGTEVDFPPAKPLTEGLATAG
ncbi:MAG TPA: carboxymuconolactone decarboxylase family protein [Opitutales bacterium]|nr:carboxymuconolactone decarboxylase family protein [Opitutales bacterium]